MKTIDDLLASIRMTNNGYIFAPTPAETAIAIKNQDVVDIRAGQIHMRGVACEYPRKPAKIDYQALYEAMNGYAPDYEGAILARQEKYLGY